MDPLDSQFAGYSEERKPLSAYAAIAGAFNVVMALFLLLFRTSDRSLPSRFGLADLLLLGAATQKASRLIATDQVTSFIRAPFTQYKGYRGVGRELKEEPRGHGMQRALGELLTCTYCVATWVAAAFTYGLALAPRATRLVASVFATLLIADSLEMAYYSLVKGSSLVNVEYKKEQKEEQKAEAKSS